MGALSGLLGKKRILILIILQIIVLSVLTTATVLFMSEPIDDPEDKWDRGETVYDPDLYHFRARTILEGGLLYKDVRTETPPVVNYLLVIPYLLGGTIATYCMFFSFVIVISTLLTYHFLSKVDEKKAFKAAALFGLAPVALVVPAVLIDDEAMNVIFLLLPLLLLTVNSRKVHYVVTTILGAGIWVKIFPGFAALARILDPRVQLRKKTKDMAIYILLTSIICLPFLILAGGDFIWFLKFYFLGIGTIGEGERAAEKGLEGQSLWRLMDYHGIAVPDILLISLLVIAVIAISVAAYRRKFNPWKVTVLMLLAFYLFYPKVHTPYFIYLLAALAPYCVDKKVAYGALNIAILLLHLYKTVVIDQEWLGVNFLTSLWGFSMALIVTALLVHLFVRIYREDNWIDRHIVKIQESMVEGISRTKDRIPG
jgi:hypothetical protein